MVEGQEDKKRDFPRQVTRHVLRNVVQVTSGVPRPGHGAVAVAPVGGRGVASPPLLQESGVSVLRVPDTVTPPARWSWA